MCRVLNMDLKEPVTVEEEEEGEEEEVEEVEAYEEPKMSWAGVRQLVSMVRNCDEFRKHSCVTIPYLLRCAIYQIDHTSGLVISLAHLTRGR